MGSLQRLAALLMCVPMACGAAGVPGQGTWETTLQPRDLDADGHADAFYDTVLKVTWLRDADMMGAPRFLSEARAWVDGLTVGGYDDWRLPKVIDTGDNGCDWAYAGTDCGYNVQTTGRLRVYSEMATLLQVTLGNTPYCNAQGQCDVAGWGLSNTGDFTNLRSDFYWIGTSYGPLGVFAWYYYTPTIYQAYGVSLLGMHAMALRDGDSGVALPLAAAVPEPSGAWLWLVGLLWLGRRTLARSNGR